MNKPILRVAPPYDESEIRSITQGFEALFGKKLDFEVVPDESLLGGFVARIGNRVFDASLSLSPFREDKVLSARDMDFLEDEEPELESVSDFLRRRIEQADLSPDIYESGSVKSCADGIVQIDGLPHSRYGELLSFEGGIVGLALDLRLDGVGAVLLGGESVLPGTQVRGTGHVADICVGEELLGRVIDAIGRALDGKALNAAQFRPIECPAPSIMHRAAVNTPLETGILAVDSMIPIGRGQRELIIGDRQTGKTSIALSAILNQKGKGVLCVYCAVGQKASSVAGVVHTLEQAGALSNTVVVSASAADSAAMQYIAPYAACSIAEHFMLQGRDVLIVYDDLSKHAVAYRAMSLLLRRPSGREAYPGDVFYLHSRLLERAARLSEEAGGGSMTALPIVETLAGDISAYIPTNVISITDGQIYLESELFNAGVRPAINVGLSVSRVGRSAQTKAMKQVSGSLRLSVAQYRDMAVFAQFGADIDAATAQMLRDGERLTELLKQPQEELLPLSRQVCLLLAAENGVFSETPISQVAQRRAALLSALAAEEGSTLRAVDSTGALTQAQQESLVACMERFKARKDGEGDAADA